MLEDDRLDVSERNDVDKTKEQKYQKYVIFAITGIF